MRITHVALFTHDLERMKEFYTRYFNGIAGPLYHNSAKGFRSYFTMDPDGNRVELVAGA